MALSFDGTNDRVDHGDINAIDGTSVLSGAMWYYPEAALQAGLLVGKTAGINSDALRVSHGQINTPTATTNFYVFLGIASSDGNNRFGRSTSVFTSGVWHHLAFAYDGAGATDADKLQMYWNGVAETVDVPNAVLSTAITANATPVTVGVTNADTGDLSGRISNLKIWNAHLSESELQAEMWSFYAKHRDSLILDTADYTTATDWSGAGNHGTITDATPGDGPPVPYGGE